MPAPRSAPTAAALVQDIPTMTLATLLGFAAMLLVSSAVFLTDGAGLPMLGSGLTGF